MISGMDWIKVFAATVEVAEYHFDVEGCLVVDSDILHEIDCQARQTVATYRKSDPNPAKIAGHISFWIRKLKPIAFSPHSTAMIFEIIFNTSLPPVPARGLSDPDSRSRFGALTVRWPGDGRRAIGRSGVRATGNREHAVLRYRIQDRCP
jgi:hypothetical protein